MIIIFILFLNLFLILKERNKEESRESQGLKELINIRINDYVEEVLMPYFANLICFVKECEIIIEKDNLSLLKTYESEYIYYLLFISVRN
jgi:hypothetical protein